ncbi:MAG: hypothetical protein E6G27_15640 [Actinobacteria bacterium]|nr:MAG: hypothetical protein E6G27_15640 [Actinomycetota bacterium]
MTGLRPRWTRRPRRGRERWDRPSRGRSRRRGPPPELRPLPPSWRRARPRRWPPPRCRARR